MRQLTVAALAAALLFGCTPDRPKLPSLPAAFATLPLPPMPEYLGQSGSEDALMFTFRSAWPADSVAALYERLFEADTMYRMVSRNTPEAGHAGSIVELTGAVIADADTTDRTVAGSASPDTAAARRATAPRP